MKKIVLPLLFLCLTSASLSAQEEAQEATTSNDYNKWSIDINGGLNKPTNPMAPGYYIKSTNFFHADLGFRYMFNPKFGLKFSGGYDTFENADNSLPFETKVISIGLEGYANLGRIMQFESWTQRLNLLGHLGVGVSRMENDRFEGQDHIGNFIMGLTAQYKISNRVALNADVTMLNSFHHDKTWDGSEYDKTLSQGFDATRYTATLGLSIYLGKHEQHADWFVDAKSDELEDVEKRLGELETMMNDSDKDGVPDYLDTEPNTITGVAVDSKGRTIDKNGNGVPDELESYIENQGKNGTSGTSGMDSDLAALINGGYVNVYFDFGKEQPNTQSVSGINFLIRYLKQNPTVSSDVIGYADEIGASEFNKNLSRKRAENVKQILMDAGIDGSRLNIVGNGEDNSVNKTSSYARQVVRRVTFMLK
jgi:OOP family OmpA-OmpF porin